MTRDYNQQRRFDRNPSSRHSPPSGHGEERPPRPARPRLNRQSVDRAWEAGARRDHADYHTRSNDEQFSRDNRGYNSDYPPMHNSRKPFHNYQDRYQRSDRPYNDQHTRSRSHGSNARYGDDSRSGNRRDYSPRFDRGRSDSSDNEQYRDRRPQFRDRDRGYERRDPDRDQRRNYERRDYERTDRSPRSFERGSHPSRNYQQRDTQQPRWQQSQDDDRPRRRYNFSKDERFEGDYESFETPERSQRLARSSSQEHAENETRERHVTRLPDGRVLKGPRPVQRRNAQFWTEVSHDTNELVGQVDTPAPMSNAASQEVGESTTSHKPRKRAVSKAVRENKAEAKQKKSRSSGPKPSQRGYRWPAP